MYIIVFLHSDGNGKYLGYHQEGYGDLFEFVGINRIELIDEGLNQRINECIPANAWAFAHDSLFKIELKMDSEENDDFLYPINIELMINIYRPTLKSRTLYD